MPACPFCDPFVINKQTILDGTFCLVLLNIRPANKGQCLVVPKRHVNTIRELTDPEVSELFFMVKKVSKVFQTHLHPIGFNYGFNEGHYSGQRVDHLHVHVIPRVKGDKGHLPEYHLFHRHPESVRNFTPDELQPLVDEFRSIFNS